MEGKFSMCIRPCIGLMVTFISGMIGGRSSRPGRSSCANSRGRQSEQLGFSHCTSVQTTE